MTAPRQKLHRLRDSAYTAWGHGLTSITRLRGTELWARQDLINRNSAELVAAISRRLSADTP